MIKAVRATIIGAALALSHISYAQEVVIPPPAAEIDLGNLEIARQIIEIGLPPENRETIFIGTANQLEQQMRDAILPTLGTDDPGIIAIFDKWIAEMNSKSTNVLKRHIPSLVEGMARSYAVTFDRQELEDILAFVSTRSGQRFFELGSGIAADPNFANANQAYLEEVFSTLPEAQADLVERIRQYLANKGDAAD